MISNFMQLVPRYLLQNKKRTITIAFSIIISVMLLTSVGIIISSYNELAINAMGQKFGKYHGEFRNIEYDNLEKSRGIPLIKTIGTSLKLGEYKSDKFALEIIGADNIALDMLNCNIVEGNYPQNINEIILEQWVINKMEQKPAIGDKISLDYEIFNIMGISIGREKTDFILTGIMENSFGTLSAGKGKAYVTLQTAEQNIKGSRSYRQYFLLNTSPNIRQELIKVRELLSIRNANENIFGDYSENSPYVDSIENAYKSRKLIFLIDVIVAIFAVMVIYNVYNISVVERLKHFGLLRAIGATPKQIKYMLLAEALILGVIFVPAGIILGLIGSKLLLLLISKIALYQISIKINLFNIVLPFIMGFLSILTAVYNSAKLGAAVSPIEAINSESKIKIRKKQADINSLWNKLILSIYGQMGKMALTNIGRYKKRFLATIVTISISIALFISVFYLVKCLDPLKQMSSMMSADYVLAFQHNKEKTAYTEETIRKLENIEGIEKINKLKYKSCNIYIDTKYLTEAGKKYYEEEAKYHDYVSRSLNRGEVDLIGFVIGLNEELYNEYFKDYEETRSYNGQEEALPNVFIVHDINHEGHTNLNPGDIITISFSYKENNIWNKTTQDFVIADILDKSPIPISKGDGSIAVFMKEELLQKYYPTDGYQKVEIYLEKDADAQAVEGKLKEIASSQKYGKVDSFREYVEMIRKVQTQMALVLYSIIVVISLVGLVNIVNTMTMNILLRKREFGLLRAIGVTKPQLREMIFKEGLLYGVLGSIFGNIMGVGLIYVIYSFGRKFLYIEFQPDYLSIIFASAVTIILCITATLMPIKRVTSSSIVESIGAVE